MQVINYLSLIAFTCKYLRWIHQNIRWTRLRFYRDLRWYKTIINNIYQWWLNRMFLNMYHLSLFFRRKTNRWLYIIQIIILKRAVSLVFYTYYDTGLVNGWLWFMNYNPYNTYSHSSNVIKYIKIKNLWITGTCTMNVVVCTK